MRFTADQIRTATAASDRVNIAHPFIARVIDRMPEFDACPCEPKELAEARLGHAMTCKRPVRGAYSQAFAAVFAEEERQR